ncbi:MAG: hypothetical protein ACP5OP_06490 [Leptospirillia bacterium]
MATIKELVTDHSRQFSLRGRTFLSVYPVFSRRARGISVGVNLNLDRGCNFDCIYCQVDRSGSLSSPLPSLKELPEIVREELGLLFEAMVTGEFFSVSPFEDLPVTLRSVKDIAFSGDGEPTLSPVFIETARIARDFLAEKRMTGEAPLLRLITNGTGLFSRDLREKTQKIFLEKGPGEIWLKLDAATPAFFDRIDRAHIPFSRMMEGLEEIVLSLPVTLQTMVLDFGSPGSPGSFASDRTFWEPLLERVDLWSRRGAKIRAWHLYGVARTPALLEVRRVDPSRLHAYAGEARERLPFPVEVFE